MDIHLRSHILDHIRVVEVVQGVKNVLGVDHEVKDEPVVVAVVYQENVALLDEDIVVETEADQLKNAIIQVNLEVDLDLKHVTTETRI